MNNEQIRLLSKMKKLIEKQERQNPLNITEEEAWNYILRLNSYYYFPDLKPFYSRNGESLVFKMKINDNIAYIKLKIENSNNGEETVCISFHKDNKY